MKKITFTSNYGNFAYRMTAEIGDSVNPETEFLCMQGLANICYRVAGSNVDKALGAKERKAVEWSDEDGERITAAVSEKITALEVKSPELKKLSLDFAVTGQHEFGTASADAGKAALGMAELFKDNPGALAAFGVDAGEQDLQVIAKAISAFNAKFRKPREAKAKVVVTEKDGVIFRNEVASETRPPLPAEEVEA